MPDNPLIGLQAPGLDGIQTPIADIETLAAQLIEEMRRVQPAGPYFIGGASFGGIVAYEMSCLLQMGGEEVGRLIILDHSPRNYPKTQVFWLKQLVRYPVYFFANLLPWLKNFFALEPGQRIARVRRRVGVMIKAFQFTLGARRDIKPDLVAADILDDVTDFPEHRLKIIETNSQALVRYTPKTITGKITYFQAHTRPFFPEVPKAEEKWRRLATGGVTVISVPGSHDNFLKEPHVREVALELIKVIQGDDGEIK
jgi:thioesterase domain-containing protein